MILIRLLYSVYVHTLFVVLLFIGILWYLIVAIFRPKNAIDDMYQYIYFWANSLLFLSAIPHKIYGKEHINDHTSYIIVANHVANADLYSAASALSLRYRVLGKIELSKLPFLGFLFSKTVVFVDRKDEKSRALSYLKMKALVAEHLSVLIFPEGTRNRGEHLLNSFYDGAFRLAIEMQQPILPLIFFNGKKVWDNDTWMIKRHPLKSIFLAPIPTVGLALQDVERLKAEVWQIMFDKINEEIEV